MSLPVGTRVKLSTGSPCPKRGRWVIQQWLTENGEGVIEEVGPDYVCVAIEKRADGSPIVNHKRTQVIHETDKRYTITPLEPSQS